MAEVGRLVPEFEVVEMSGIAVRSLENRVQEKALLVRVEDASYMSYLPIPGRLNHDVGGFIWRER